MTEPTFVSAALALSLLVSLSTSAGELTPYQQLGRDIYRELIEINTTATTGDTARAAEAMAVRLVASGLPAADVHVFKCAPRKGNLVARLRGTGARRPVLFIAHLDVVEAPREGWSFDPFKLTERNGYFYGRGTSDDKCGAAALVAMLIRLQREGYRPNRDIIAVLETDEETTGDGIKWLLQEHRELLDAEYALNEDGSYGMEDGRLFAMEFQTSEKLYQSYWLEVRHPGGLSSLPPKDTAIYRLAAGLTRLAQSEFPARLNETTRAYFERMASLKEGQLALDMKAVSQPEPDPAAIVRLSANPLYNALLRTTCVATRLEAGHADNALPLKARALVNCRILPGETPAEVRQTIIRVLADDGIVVTGAEEAVAGPSSPLNTEVLHAVERVTAELWPGTPVIPTMAVWATEGMFLPNAGIPTYCLDGFARDQVDVREREHGNDERLPVKSFYKGLEFNHRLAKALSGGERPERVLPTQ
jgi:acetylornithine deacetylase/succinyl-diaminopimelate desuccinylase-like protein